MINSELTRVALFTFFFFFWPIRSKLKTSRVTAVFPRLTRTAWQLAREFWLVHWSALCVGDWLESSRCFLFIQASMFICRCSSFRSTVFSVIWLLKQQILSYLLSFISACQELARDHSSSYFNYFFLLFCCDKFSILLIKQSEIPYPSTFYSQYVFKFTLTTSSRSILQSTIRPDRSELLNRLYSENENCCHGVLNIFS